MLLKASQLITRYVHKNCNARCALFVHEIRFTSSKQRGRTSREIFDAHFLITAAPKCGASLKISLIFGTWSQCLLQRCMDPQKNVIARKMRLMTSCYKLVRNLREPFTFLCYISNDSVNMWSVVNELWNSWHEKLEYVKLEIIMKKWSGCAFSELSSIAFLLVH